MSASGVFEEWDVYANRRKLAEGDINLDAVIDAPRGKSSVNGYKTKR